MSSLSTSYDRFPRKAVNGGSSGIFERSTSGPLAALGAVGKAALSMAARLLISEDTPPYASSGQELSTVNVVITIIIYYCYWWKHIFNKDVARYENDLNPGVTYLDWKRSSGWLEFWEGLLFATDILTTCAEAIFRVLTLKKPSSESWLSVINNSPSQDSNNLDDLFQ